MAQTLAQRKETALEQLRAITSARRGQLSAQYYTRRTADGRTVRQGPYYVWQRYVNGHKRSVRVTPAQLTQVQADLERGRDLQAIFDELFLVLEETATGQDLDLKKKNDAVQAARHRETEASLELIRERLRANGQLDLAWIERTLREACLRDLARMLEGLLNHEIPRLLGPPSLKPGERLHSYQSRRVDTIAGPITIRRAYYRGPRAGRYPLDEALQLHDRYTPAVVQLMCWAGAMDGSFDLAAETLHRFAGLTIPGRQIQRVVNARGASVAAWREGRPPDQRPTPVTVLNIQTDMTGIPARPEDLVGIQGKQPDGSAKTRQIKVGCVFTQTNDAQGTPQRDPFSSTYLAAFCDVTDFGTKLRSEALKRGYATARETVFLGDGAEWIWNIATNYFKDAIQIVDFYHACEHLHRVCQLFEPDQTKAKILFRKWRTRLRNNGLPGLLRDTAERAQSLPSPIHDQIETELAYFRKNKQRMTYRTFRSRGFFIGSGAVEGSCRHLVAQRTKLSGMRWHCAGAENVLAFRSLIKSNLFDAYCTHAQQVA